LKLSQNIYRKIGKVILKVVDLLVYCVPRIHNSVLIVELIYITIGLILKSIILFVTQMATVCIN